MEGDTTILREYRVNIDNGLTDVMPESWAGHARLAIRTSDVVPHSIEEETIEKANTIADKKGVSPERAANLLISHIAEKRSEQP